MKTPVLAGLASLGGLLVAAAVLPAGEALAQANAPAPRLAWLGGERGSLERSSGYGYGGPAARPGIWQGFYAGIDGGYAWASAEPIQRYDSIHLDSGYVGGHLGYNWQFNRVVLGAEADLGWRWGEGSRSFEDSARLDASAGLLSSYRLRAGIAFDNLLLYATGGLALGRFDASLTTLSDAGSTRETFAGYVVGGGLEMKITSHLSGRVEGLYYGFDDKSFGLSGGALKSDLSTTTIRAGISYHFH